MLLTRCSFDFWLVGGVLFEFGLYVFVDWLAVLVFAVGICGLVVFAVGFTGIVVRWICVFVGGLWFTCVYVLLLLYFVVGVLFGLFV